MRNHRGFALVTVLWALVVIGILAVEFHTLARADRRVATNARVVVQTRWAARAGLARTLDALDRALGANQLAAVGDTVLRLSDTEENGVRVRGAVLDVSARLQLNRVGRRELVRLMEALSIQPADAQRLADAVGAAPLERVEELQSLPGMTAAIYDRLAPHVTVTGDGRVNVNSASVPVLRTLPGIDAEGASAIVIRRSAAPYRNVFEVLGSMPGPVQVSMQSRLGELVDRITFAPRVAEIAIVASTPRQTLQSELIATVLFPGGLRWSVQQVTERF